MHMNLLPIKVKKSMRAVSKPDGSQLPPPRHHLVRRQRRDQGRPQWRPETVDPV